VNKSGNKIPAEAFVFYRKIIFPLSTYPYMQEAVVRMMVVLIIAPPQIMSFSPLLAMGWMRATKGIGLVALKPPAM
jgi:hypothetical protein